MIVAAVVVGVVALLFVGMYNSLVRKKNQVTNVFGTIDAMLKKRYDLIPNLVAVAKEYMKHEERVLTEVTRLRARALSGDASDEEKIDIDRRMSEALKGIMVAVENYPGLRANDNFLQLQSTLNVIEEQISAARRAYNAAVTEYNNAIEMFPTNVVASLFAYRPKRVFAIPAAERDAVDVHALLKR
jgi:LemA protein